ncbi:MAG: DUF488 domain-containing protein [Ktedonobacteraceae bacterium]
MISKIITIGVYGFTEQRFFQALQDTHIDTFCDLRARRGLRGSEYPFANSARLQQHLAELHIRYIHLKQLAPSEEIRQLQRQADKQAKIAKRKRGGMSEGFRVAYQQGFLNTLDAKDSLKQVGSEAKVLGLFCVEREPEACHRSLVAAWFAQELGVHVEHITP